MAKDADVGGDGRPGGPEPTGDRDAPTTELDRDVLDAFRTGDPDALAAVYRRYARPVWGLAMTILRDRQLAEDAVTEAFLRAWRVAATYDPDRALGPWLFTIARRAALDTLRRESRPTRGGHEPEQDAAVDPPSLSAVWEAWQVRTALAELPEDERDIVRLAHYEGLSHAEIAGTLEIPMGTVKSRSHRAHRRLADRLRHLRATEEDVR